MKIKFKKLKQIICASFVLTTQAALAIDLQCEKDYKTVISNNIVEMSKAFNTENIQYIEDKTHSSLIDYAGGKEAYRDILTFAVHTFRKANMIVTHVETLPPQGNYIVGENEICFIPKQLTMEINGNQHVADQSFMLAVRSTSSKEWKYLDGAGLKKNPDMLYTLFPDFSRKIRIPLLNQ